MPASTPSRHAADLRGLSQLAVDAVTGTTDLVEAVHAAVTHLPSALGRRAPAKTSGLTGWVYGRVRGVTSLVGAGLDASLSTLAPLLGKGEDHAQRDAVLAAMNGVLGDHLAATGNPLAIEMAFRRHGSTLPLARRALARAIPDASGTIVVLLHGLCMNDRQWLQRGHDHGAALAHDLGVTSVYLRYNSGRHISCNGLDVARLLEPLVAAWPRPVERVVLIGHSMGGLVARSACAHAADAGSAWLTRLSDIVFLGTPHHGAPLERAGTWIDRLIGVSPYSAPFARIGGLRGAGIRDLRHGYVRDTDWQSEDASSRDDPRTPLPLPAGVRCHAIATTTQARDPARDPASLRGDGLVPIDSALGRHPDRAFDLRIPRSRQWIGYGINHLELLGSDEVYRRIVRALGKAPRAMAGKPAKTRTVKSGTV